MRSPTGWLQDVGFTAGILKQLARDVATKAGKEGSVEAVQLDAAAGCLAAIAPAAAPAICCGALWHAQCALEWRALVPRRQPAWPRQWRFL